MVKGHYHVFRGCIHEMLGVSVHLERALGMTTHMNPAHSYLV